MNTQDSSYGNDSLSSGANPGSGLGRDQFNDSSNYNRPGALGSDDITDRGNNFSGGNSSSGLGRDDYSSSGRDTYGSNTGRDTFSSSGDNYGSSNTGYGSSGNDNYGSSGLTGSGGIHHQTSATGSFGDDDLVNF